MTLEEIKLKIEKPSTSLSIEEWLELEKAIKSYMDKGMSEKEWEELNRDIPLDLINMTCEGIRYEEENK